MNQIKKILKSNWTISIVTIIVIVIIVILQEQFCKVNWEIFQKYIESLIWPLIVIILLIIYRNELTSIIKKISESEIPELSILGVKFILEAKNILNDDNKSPVDKVEKLKKYFSNQIIEQIFKLGERYLRVNSSGRERIRHKIASISRDLKVEDIDVLLSASTTGEKIGASRAIKNILQNRKSEDKVYSNEKLKTFIEAELESESSFLRHNIVHLVFLDDQLYSDLKHKMNELSQNDPNERIRSVIRSEIIKKS